MEKTEIKEPACLFEVSWEVCNKVGGIHTVVSTKVLSLVQTFKNEHILIGPDVWRRNEPNPEFTEDVHLYRSWRAKLQQEGLRVKIGRWNVAGNPVVLLVDFTPFISQKNDILTAFFYPGNNSKHIPVHGRHGDPVGNRSNGSRGVIPDPFQGEKFPVVRRKFSSIFLHYCPRSLLHIPHPVIIPQSFPELQKLLLRTCGKRCRIRKF